jgi:hypothetical protein
VRTVREALDDGGRGVAEPRSLLEHRGTFLLEPFLWECEEPLLIEADAVRLVRSGPWAPERRVRLAAAPTAVDEEHAVDLAHFIGGLLTPHMLAPEPPVSEDTPHGATVTHVSSVDAEGQGGDNVLLFEESDAFVKFWSSAGGTATSTDSLTISVTPNFIAGLVIRFFRAQFQVGMPLFPPHVVRLTVRSPAGSVTSTYRVAIPDATTEVVWIPMALEWVGTLEIEFEGKHQTQRSDGLYYVCLHSIKILGWRRDLATPTVLARTRTPAELALLTTPEVTATNSQVIDQVLAEMRRFEDGTVTRLEVMGQQAPGACVSRDRLANDVLMAHLHAAPARRNLSAPLLIAGSLDYLYEQRGFVVNRPMRVPNMMSFDDLLFLSEVHRHDIAVHLAHRSHSISVFAQEQILVRIMTESWEEVEDVTERMVRATLVSEERLVPMLVVRAARVARFWRRKCRKYARGLAIVCATLSARRLRSDDVEEEEHATLDRANATWLASLVQTVLPNLTILPDVPRPWDTEPHRFVREVKTRLMEEDEDAEEEESE